MRKISIKQKVYFTWTKLIACRPFLRVAIHLSNASSERLLQQENRYLINFIFSHLYIKNYSFEIEICLEFNYYQSMIKYVL